MMTNENTFFMRTWGIPSDSIPPLVCLHGFTGSSETFEIVFGDQQLDFQVIAIDLVGHGKTGSFRDTSHFQFEQACDDVVQFLYAQGITYFSLLGYSMGARLSLGIASKYPDKLCHLILESGSPGLKTKEEATKRRLSDEKLASKIETEGLVSFVDFWEELPLFHTQKQLDKVTQEKVRKERLSQTTSGLASSLRFMGTGVQPSYWKDLSFFSSLDVVLIVGELDSKFVSIGAEMKEENPQFELVIVKGAGHCVHLEKPATFLKLIIDTLKR